MKKCPVCKMQVDELEISISLTLTQEFGPVKNTQIKIGFACPNCGVLFIDLSKKPMKTIHVSG